MSGRGTITFPFPVAQCSSGKSKISRTDGHSPYHLFALLSAHPKFRRNFQYESDRIHYIIFVSTSTLISHKTYNYCSTILTFYIGLILLFLDMKLPSYRTFIFHCPIMRVVYQVEHILFYLLFLSDRYSFNHTAISPFSRLPQ